MTGARALRRAAAVLAALAMLAASASPARAVVTYDFSLGGRAMNTDNLHLDHEPLAPGERAPVHETIYAAVPALAFQWTQGRDRLSLDTRGEYWAFTGDEEIDPMWIPNLTTDLVWRRTAPFFLEAEGVSERVPSTEDRESQSVLDEADRTFVRLRSGLSWERGANRVVELAYHGELEYFSGGHPGSDDRVARHYAEGMVRHQWSPLWWTQITGQYGLIDQRLAGDYTEMRVAGSLDYRFSERLTARARLEWVRDDYDAFAAPDGGEETPAHETTSFLKSAEIRGQLERGGFWALDYEDRLEAQPDGDTLKLGRAAGNVELHARLGSLVGAEIWHETRDFRESGRDETDWGPTLLARWAIAPWLALDLGGSWTRASIQEPGVVEIVDKTGRAAAALVVLLGRHFVAEAGYSYRTNDSTDDTRSYTANLYYAGLTYHFAILAPGTIPASEVRRMASSDDTLAGRR